MRNRKSTVLTWAASSLTVAGSAYAQVYGVAGDQITSTVSSALGYLQKFALGVFGILLVVGALRMGFDPQNPMGLKTVVSCIIGIAITILATVVVQVVQGWTGNILGF